MNLTNGVVKRTIFLSLLSLPDTDRGLFLFCAAIFLAMAVLAFAFLRRKRRPGSGEKQVSCLTTDCLTEADTEEIKAAETDTAEMPDPRELLYKCYGFRVEEDITYTYIADSQDLR